MLAIRLLGAAALLAVIHAGVLVIQRNYVPAEVTLPERELGSLPMELGPWTGEDVELDPRVYRAIGAHSVLNRRFRGPTRQEVLLHSAILTDATSSVGHYPFICYPGSGWEILDSKNTRLKLPDAPEVLARLLFMRRDGEQIVALYWYQMGAESFVDRDSYRHARRSFFGKDVWPPAIKVLLQVPATNSDQAEERLMEFAKLVYEWTKDYP